MSGLDLLGLRDRALLGIMVFSFARIGAVIQMKVGDYFVQGRRRWVRLQEKGGKEQDVPCHHRLDHIEAAGIADDVDGYLFRTARRKSRSGSMHRSHRCWLRLLPKLAGRNPIFEIEEISQQRYQTLKKFLSPQLR
jgi:integrase